MWWQFLNLWTLTGAQEAKAGARKEEIKGNYIEYAYIHTFTRNDQHIVHTGFSWRKNPNVKIVVCSLHWNKTTILSRIATYSPVTQSVNIAYLVKRVLHTTVCQGKTHHTEIAEKVIIKKKKGRIFLLCPSFSPVCVRVARYSSHSWDSRVSPSFSLSLSPN